MTVPHLVATAEQSASDAPLLVLGPSLGSVGSTLWSTTIPHMADRFRIVTWDLPGHGASPKATESFTIADLADGVIAILDEIGAEKALYAGVSMGGGTGLQLALRHPDRIERVAMVCASYRFRTPEAWRERADQVRTQSTSSLVVATAQVWFAPGRMEANPVISGTLLHNLQDADDESYALACEALAQFDLESRLADITIPVLDVWGDKDPTITWDSALKIASTVPQGAAVAIEDAAHLAPADQPEAVAEVLIDFFA